MSLPIAHALVGTSILAALDDRVDFCSRRSALLIACLLPAAPDLDFLLVWLFGYSRLGWHRTFSHSVTFSVLFGLALAAGVAWRRRGSPRWAFVFGTALMLSHAVIDMFGHGASGGAGRGVMLLWPFDAQFYAAPWQFLPPGIRGSLIIYARTALTELVYLGPPAALIWWWRARDRRRPC